MSKAEALQPSTTVAVELGARRYEIAIGAGVLAEAGKRIRPFLKRPVTAIVTDSAVAALHLDTLRKSLEAEGVSSSAIILPPGEATKSYKHLAETCDQLLAAGIERRDIVIALGGGVIGDLTGFAAAILRRGVDFIQIPTTLLAQVDSSVGGKTGINSPHGKNLIGAFHQPRAVLIDIALLDTLPKRELAAGYAEVAKYGLLGDAGFFSWLEANAQSLFAGDAQSRIKAITKSCEMKARIVTEDETETGIRALLNLGHTFGHALEAATGYSSRLLHGEAVAVGMAQAFRFSERLGLCAKGLADRAEKHLRAAGLPTRLADIPGDLPGPDKLLEIMRQDKKAVAGKLTFILVRDIGEAFIARDIKESDVLAFLMEEQSRT
ncbi:3-dehydroquinate synthase [Nordella sp. HKS 07]|uniref:3-dehydroquinate synthase n=1 Tax=Nordella sp. HKS 07 TaxID=2712222 RepID=UPI0013E19A9B|nr:3-dehydroquinate synthase [Nordella sp. HKS 07]QIG47147.1 3-dehydroquinate synthase [Nordella sp. HKS 07]